MVRPTARKQAQSMALGWDGQTSLTNRWDVSLCACVIKKRDGRASWLVCGYSATRRRKFFCSKILVLNQVLASPAENCEDNAEKPLFFGIQTGLEILKKAFAEC